MARPFKQWLPSGLFGWLARRRFFGVGQLRQRDDDDLLKTSFFKLRFNQFAVASDHNQSLIGRDQVGDHPTNFVVRNL